MAKWVQLAAARERKHLSQAETAKYLNVSVVTYQRWETGKAKPQPQRMQQLCAFFTGLEVEVQHAELLEMNAPFLAEVCAEQTPDDVMETFIATHMPTHLFSLAFLRFPTHTDRRNAIRQAIKKFDSTHVNDKDYQMTRSEALCSLAILPFITIGLVVASNTVQRSRYKDALEHCAASVEACWELRLSDNPTERLLAFQCAAAYLPLLKTILLDPLQDREEVLHLATRYAIIKTYLARHCVGLAEAIQYGKDAVALSKETGDSFLQNLSTLFLMQSYLCAKKYMLAFTIAQASEIYWLQHTYLPNAQPLHSYVQGKTYSPLARMQVKNGVSLDASLRKATGKSLHFWKAEAEDKILKSEMRLSEAIANYELMQAIWSGESRIEELRDYLGHWAE